MGHLFPQEFRLLNHDVKRFPHSALYEIEREIVIAGDAQQFIRLGHDHMGGYLLEKWRLPEAVSACAYYHHDDLYSGEFSEYVELIQVCNQLLATREIGDIGGLEQTALTWSTDLITQDDAMVVFGKVMELCPELDNLADNMAA